MPAVLRPAPSRRNALSAPDLSARIERLFVYPIKSCAGVELREAVLTETGLDLDRAWMVVDEEG
ncbi:MAG: MOSC N-terminal beta barrel domain-containing protein, partial [Comamonas sp.]